jgi:hypothetical protein
VKPQKDKGRIHNFLEVQRQINNREGYNQLQDDLIEHLWEFHGRQRRQS